ncbi:MAG: WecB/TagA/CpsF family glycosyltransferase [Methylobacteriaceae bacterium]|nr:WecB/TagA/CpsF family glycosyltransferase [Methylobacteriaceae bacterium]
MAVEPTVLTHSINGRNTWGFYGSRSTGERPKMLELASSPVRRREHVLGIPVDVLSWSEAVDRIFGWALRRESKTVCLCNVDSVVTARRNRAHADAINSADLVAPDGAPVAWSLRKKGHVDQERIGGPDLMWTCCLEASKAGTEMFLYGGTSTTLQSLAQKLRTEFRGINIVGAFSPPFRDLSTAEDAAIVDLINGSGARIVWVALGCPKQEAWMRAHRGRVNAVMVGVGAAFDFHAGVVKRAPLWMRRNGLEWLHRLLKDPRRLAARYFVGNSIFLIAVLLDLVRRRSGPTRLQRIS